MMIGKLETLERDTETVMLSLERQEADIAALKQAAYLSSQNTQQLLLQQAKALHRICTEFEAIEQRRK